jgi:hypothetical protein
LIILKKAEVIVCASTHACSNADMRMHVTPILKFGQATKLVLNLLETCYVRTRGVQLSRCVHHELV